MSKRDPTKTEPSGGFLKTVGLARRGLARSEFRKFKSRHWVALISEGKRVAWKKGQEKVRKGSKEEGLQATRY